MDLKRKIDIVIKRTVLESQEDVRYILTLSEYHQEPIIKENTDSKKKMIKALLSRGLFDEDMGVLDLSTLIKDIFDNGKSIRGFDIIAVPFGCIFIDEYCLKHGKRLKENRGIWVKQTVRKKSNRKTNNELDGGRRKCQ